MAGFGVDAAVETSGRSVCVTSAGQEPFSLRLQIDFPNVTLREHPAELFSRQLLSEKVPDRKDVLHLFDLLPREESSRGNPDPLAFGCGCWVRDAGFGLRRNNRVFPASVQLLNVFVRSVRPSHVWTSIVIFADVRAPRHRDLRNNFDPNLVVALSQFEGGNIFVIQPEGPEVAYDAGETVRGIILDPRSQPCLLHARRDEHFTLPWRGRRVVLVAFCIDHVLQLTDGQRGELCRLGFRPPSEGSLPPPRQCSAQQMCLEIFSAPPRLSESLRRVEVRTLSLHHAPLKAWTVPCLKWDVQQPLDVEFCLQRLRQGSVSFLFVVPPGGLQSLTTTLNEAVLTFLVLLLATLGDTQTPFCLCLPCASAFWKPVLAQTVGLTHFVTDVDLCQYGCERKRATRLLHNVPALCALARRCDGSHSHASWSPKTPASLQPRHLPPSFCDHVVQACLPLLSASVLPPSLRPASAALQGHTKLHAVPAVVPEYKEVLRRQVPPEVPLPDVIPEGGCPFLPDVPAGASRLTGGRLQRDTTLLLKGAGHASCRNEDPPATDGRQQTPLADVSYAVPWNVPEFLEQALHAEHPCDKLSGCEPSAEDNIQWITSTPAAEVCAFRTNALKALLQSEAELRKDEERLHASLNPEVGRVLKGKRLLLFKKLASAAGVEDDTLFQQMCEGFKILGYAEPSGQFPVSFKPASMSEHELKQASSWIRGMLKKPDSRESNEIAEGLWAEALDQAQDGSGWLYGPYSERELDELFPEGWVPSRRFGVQQGDRTRAIDDLRASLVNSTCTATDKIVLQDIDVVAQTARKFLEALASRRRADQRQLVGRALDLKSAYKQLASAPCDGWASILAVWRPDKQQYQYFRFATLPFGAVHSVTAFNRVAKALRTILLKIVRLVVTSFYDDFCQLELQELAGSAQGTAQLVLQLLGWRIAEDPNKCLPFSKVFSMLGASFSLSRAPQGILEISNKEGRLQALRAMVNAVCTDGFVQPAVLASLKGRFLYASTHTFGRVAAMAVKCLSRHLAGGGILRLDNEDCTLLQQTIDLLEDMRPREICAGISGAPVVIFTDGAHEEDDCLTTHGAVMIDPSSGLHLFFGEEIPQNFVDKWRAGGRQQLVGQAEVLPVLVAKVAWAKHLKHRKVLWFIDNDSAKAALGSGSSPVRDTFAMLCVNAHLDVALEATHWYTRVPSKANLADDASRLSFGAYQGLYEHTHVDWTSSCMQTIVATCTGEKIPSLALDTSTPEFIGEESC